MTDPMQRLYQRRAIEALRAGVPNRDAVRVLPSAQRHIEERFMKLLEDARTGVASGEPAAGWLVAGEFGSGKSHLLEHLQHLALEEGFVCSKVVISKETPLHDPTKLYRAALASAVVPDRKGSALPELAAGIKRDSSELANLLDWTRSAGAQLSSLFAATVFLWGQATDPEVRNRLISFWAGDPLAVSMLRPWLRAHGQVAAYRLEHTPARELALQRFRFIPRLAAAAGYAGWVLLIDEVELIGRYSFRQRARSYAELARWAGRLPDAVVPGLAAVFAITADFAAAVLHERKDDQLIPSRLGTSLSPADQQLAAQAERGMRLIVRDVARLHGPTRAGLAEMSEQVRALHADAYGWSPAPIEADERLTTTSMRQYVRRWINEWDLQRLYPGEQVETEVRELAFDLSEEPALETPSDEGTDREP